MTGVLARTPRTFDDCRETTGASFAIAENSGFSMGFSAFYQQCYISVEIDWSCYSSHVFFALFGWLAPKRVAYAWKEYLTKMSLSLSLS